MMQPRLAPLRQTVAKAELAYGGAVLRDLDKAIARGRVAGLTPGGTGGDAAGG